MTLKQVGDMGSALYYQNYKADDQFFDLPHFKFLFVAQYVKQVSQESRQNKREERALNGYSIIEISSDWLTIEKLAVQEDKDRKIHFVTPSKRLFPFDYDVMGSAVQYVVPFGQECGDIKRISRNDKWMYCRMPFTTTPLYYVEKDQVVFLNLKCNLKEVEVQYVPLPDCNDDTSEIREDKIMEMIATVLNLMFGAKNGNIVDMSNNSNPNTVMQTEIDPNAGR